MKGKLELVLKKTLGRPPSKGGKLVPVTMGIPAEDLRKLRVIAATETLDTLENTKWPDIVRRLVKTYLDQRELERSK